MVHYVLFSNVTLPEGLEGGPEGYFRYAEIHVGYLISGRGIFYIGGEGFLNVKWLGFLFCSFFICYNLHTFQI